MGSSKTSFQSTLGDSVVAKGRCTNCCACVVACPYNCLGPVEQKPSLLKECPQCGICEKTCPQYDWSLSDEERFTFGKARKPEETFGVYRRLVVSRATDGAVLRVGQDGGVATALLLHALKNVLIDRAVVSGIDPNKPLFPVPKVAISFEDVLACAGTRYFYSPNLLALAEAMKGKIGIGFVGTPCQIKAIRKMQLAGLKKYDSLKFLIGLMCSECYDYDGLMKRHLHQELGLDPKDILKINIKGKMNITMRNGQIKSLRLAEVKQHARKSCESCSDFSSELADISVGGLGLNGWTFTIIRSEKGEEVFSNAERARFVQTRNASEEMHALNLLIKLSEKKRRLQRSQ